MKKELPIEAHPFVEAYQMRAFELSALQGYDENVVSWLYGKYLNCMYDPTSRELFNYTCYNRWFPNEGATLLNKIAFTTSALIDSGINIIKLSCEMIDHDNYIYGFYNEFFIPHKIAYQDHHFYHDFMIYGYDDVEKNFLSIGYTINRTYEKFEFSFEQFKKSIYLVIENKVSLNFCKVNKRFDFKLNIRELYGELDDFLHSKNRRPSSRSDRIYGLDCEREYINYINMISESGNDIDVRFSRLFMEFKKIMKQRLQYIHENVCKLNDYAITDYDIVVDKAIAIHYLCMKYNIIRKPEELQKAACIQKEIIDKEQEILYDVYKIIREYLGEDKNG